MDIQQIIMSKLNTFLLFCCGLKSLRCAALSRLNPARQTMIALPRNVCSELVDRLITTEVEYPLLRACSSSAALRAAGLHTHVRTHRTSSDPVYLIKSLFNGTF